MAAFKIFSNITDEKCADGHQDPDGSIHFTVDGDEFHHDPSMAKDYFDLLSQVGYRVEFQE